MTPRHMFGLRPLAGFSDYRSPIAGLYNCGSSTWPGGTVTGAPGHNTSWRIRADLGRGGHGTPGRRNPEKEQGMATTIRSPSLRYSPEILRITR